MTEENDHNNRPRPLLATKLDPPIRVRGLLARPELVSELVTSPQRLTLIAAPAGWGKSTVAAEWSADEAEQRPFAFVRLGPEDDDPTSPMNMSGPKTPMRLEIVKNTSARRVVGSMSRSTGRTPICSR